MRSRSLIAAGAAVLFLLYAVNFLCFFVDDEAITYVYAQNILRGRGVSYNAIEGPAEGYSNFLHVGLATLLLSGVRAAGLPKLAVFFAGKAVSLASGILLILLVAATLRRWLPDRRSHVAPLIFLALSGPIALWSCSSLETVPFVLLFTAFVVCALDMSGTGAAVVAGALGAAVVLMRVDGVLYVTVAWVAAFVFGTRARRALLLRVGMNVGIVFAAYTAWRYWYFGSLLSLPLQTKILYKLLPSQGIVSNEPTSSYLARFLHVYHPAALLALAAVWLPFRRGGEDRRPLALLAAVACVTGYAAIVGDWMMGFRFFAAAFPLLALLAGYSMAALFSRAPRTAMLASIAAILWSGMTAQAFVRLYESDAVIGWRSWWTRPTTDPGFFFAPYYTFYKEAAAIVPAGATTVNNQAGFLPFMLELENIDDLALCSRFLAALPTADVVFTETGRYHPLTAAPPLRAGDRYLVQRRPDYVIALVHLLRSANAGHVPAELLGGHFRLVHQSYFQAIYASTKQTVPVDQPDLYRENLAHPAYIRNAVLQNSRLTPDQAKARMPFLLAQPGRYALEPAMEFAVRLRGYPLYEIWLDSLTTTADAEVSLRLYSTSGAVAFEERQAIAAGRPLRYWKQLPGPVEAGAFSLEVRTRDGSDAVLEIADLRLLGQTPALKRHVEKELFSRAARRNPSRSAQVLRPAGGTGQADRVNVLQ